MINNKNRSLIYFVNIVSALVVFFLVNAVSLNYLEKYKLDFSKNNIFSISVGSKKILEDMDSEIDIKFIFSDKVSNSYPAIKNYSSRIKLMLQEYERLSNGKIKVEYIDPEPFSDDEDIAVSYGIYPMDAGDSGEKLYFGLIVSDRIGNVKVVPFFHPEREKFLEYDLSNIIWNIEHPEKKRLGIISTIALEKLLENSQYQAISRMAIMDGLYKNFNTVVLKDISSESFNNIDILLVIQPVGLSDDVLRLIEKYVLAGRKAIFLLDPYIVSAGVSSEIANDKIFSLLSRWGVKESSDRILVSMAEKVKVNGIQSDNYKKNISLKDGDMSKDHIVTMNLSKMNMSGVGSLEKSSSSKLNQLTLLSLNHSMYNVKVLDSDIKDAMIINSPNIASIYRGQAAPYFVANSGVYKNNINIAVVADVDFILDPYWVDDEMVSDYKLHIPFADNGSFVLNLASHFAGSDEMLAVRPGGTTDRPFTLVEEVAKQAEERYVFEEKELQKKLKRSEENLYRLQTKYEKADLEYSAAEGKEIEKFRQESLQVRKKLRQVRLELKKDIDKLSNIFKLIIVGIIPLLIAAISVIMAVKNSRRSSLIIS